MKKSFLGLLFLLAICCFIFSFWYSKNKKPCIEKTSSPARKVMPFLAKKVDVYDVSIIGSGPAGLTAGIYTSRAKRSTVIFAGDHLGGLLVENPTVENWPGEVSISGFDLMQKMQKHATSYGCSIIPDVVQKIDFSEFPYKIFTRGEEVYKTKSVIIAMGVERRKLGCPGEREYWTKGVSACATCDAPLFKGKKVVVVGGGTTALTEAHHLSHFAKEVILVHRRDKFRSVDPIKDVVKKDKNITVRYNSVVKSIKGDGRCVTGVVLFDKEKDKEELVPAEGLFVAIGFDPNTKFLEGQIDLTENKYIKIIDGTKTSKRGVFAAGDVIHQEYQQAIVAAGDGCKAALDCIYYLDLLKLGRK